MHNWIENQYFYFSFSDGRVPPVVSELLKLQILTAEIAFGLGRGLLWGKAVVFFYVISN